MKPTNIKEFLAKSITTRNANRDMLFQKYQRFYELNACHICDANVMRDSWSHVRSRCYECKKSLCKDHIRRFYHSFEQWDHGNMFIMCMHCRDPCKMCNTVKSDDYMLCYYCNKVICDNCRTEIDIAGCPEFACSPCRKAALNDNF